MSTHPPQTRISSLLNVGWVVTLLALAIDTVGNNATFFRLTAVYSWTIGLIFSVFFIWERRFRNTKLHPLLNRLTIILIFPISLAFTVGLSILEYMTPDNYVYSLTRINTSQLGIMALTSGLIILCNKSTNWWRQNTKSVVVSLPGVFLLVCVWIRLLPFDTFAHMTKEDATIETIQVLLLLLSAIWSLVHIYRAIVRKNLRRAGLWAAITLLLLFICGEEISWGQRLLMLETPEVLVQINVQNELTVHNIGILNDMQRIAYIALTAVVSIGAAFSAGKSKFFPSRRVIAYFIWPLLFNISTYMTSNFYPWAEVMEVHLYAGIFVWIIEKTPATTKKILETL